MCLKWTWAGGFLIKVIVGSWFLCCWHMSKMSQGFLHHMSFCSGFWVPLLLLRPFLPLLQPHAYFPLHAAVCECCTCSSPLVSSQMRLHLFCIWKKEININCNSLLLSQNWPTLVKWNEVFVNFCIFLSVTKKSIIMSYAFHSILK